MGCTLQAVGGARGRWWYLDGGLFDISHRKWMTRSYTQRAILTDTFDEVEIVPLENGSVAFRFVQPRSQIEFSR